MNHLMNHDFNGRRLDSDQLCDGRSQINQISLEALFQIRIRLKKTKIFEKNKILWILREFRENFQKIWEKKAKNPSRKLIILTEIEIFEENLKNVAIEILYIFSNNFDGKFLSCKSRESDCILVLSDGIFGLCCEFCKLWRFDSANWSRS